MQDTDIDRERALYSFRSLDTSKLQQIVSAPIAQGTLAHELAQTVLDERQNCPSSMSAQTRDVVWYAMHSRAAHLLVELNKCETASVAGYWVVQFWQLEHAMRELGMED